MNATASQQTASLYDALRDATDKQREFIADLFQQVPDLVAQKAYAWMKEQATISPTGAPGKTSLDRAQIHGLITRLVAVRDAQRVFESETAEQEKAEQKLGEGRYAVVIDGTTHFYRVTQARSGKHVGRVFIKEQAGDAFHPVMGYWAKQVTRMILGDPEAARLRYGTELGRCYRCGRSLTDETSRSLGVGPDCRSKS